MLTLLMAAPSVLGELKDEFIRRADQCLLANPKSQVSACLLLALRSVSLLISMGLLLKPTARDSFDVLARSMMESRDLLMTFRFDDGGARQRIAYWFEGKRDNAWKADRKKCVDFLMKLGADNLSLEERWSMLSVMSHPTIYAAEHSAGSLVSQMAGRFEREDVSASMMAKRADFLVSISRFIMATMLDPPGWISLGCDHSRLPQVESFSERVETVALPYLSHIQEGKIPAKSYTPAVTKSAKKPKHKS